MRGGGEWECVWESAVRWQQAETCISCNNLSALKELKEMEVSDILYLVNRKFKSLSYTEESIWDIPERCQKVALVNPDKYLRYA